MKKADIIIPHHNRHDHLKNLLEILDNKIFNIIIVSGGSFAENCNRGAKIAQTDKIILLNDDTLPSNADLIKIADKLNDFDVVSSTQIAKDNVKYYGIGLEIVNHFITHRIQTDKSRNNSLLPSAFCLGFKKKKYKLLKGFDERFKTGNEDVDIGLRALDKKMKMIILDLEIKHAESQSDGRFKFCQQNNDLFESIYSQEYLKEKYENTIDINEIKKIKIAIICNTMASLSGSPVYHYTLAKELAIQGYEVFFYSYWGKYFLDLESYGVRRFNPDHPPAHYDLLLISQPTSAPILNHITADKVFNIVHSEYPCETPIISDKIKHYIAIRPSIKKHLIEEHGIDEKDITVIYNGVDLNRFNWTKRKKHEGDYTKIVLPCTFDRLRIPFIEHYTRQASERFRVFLIGQDYKNKFYRNEFVSIHPPVEDIENYIADADYVAGILLGRVNLEAAAMGISSFIHNPAKPSEIEVFAPTKKEFNKRHNISNVANDIIQLYTNVQEKQTTQETPENTDLDLRIKKVFTNIFVQNKGNDNESVSGSGSNMTQTQKLRRLLPRLFQMYRIKTILDIPCGDFYWFSKVDLRGVEYTGADIVSPLIEILKNKYKHNFLNLDICNSDLPQVDLVFVRDCFVHFPNEFIKKALENIKRSGSKYLLTTSFTDRTENKDIPLGRWRPINLQKAPFNMPTPTQILNENCTEGNGTYKDKSMILIKITDL